MTEMIATNTDGSGHYEMSIDNTKTPRILTTVIKDYNGRAMECMTQLLTRNTDLDTEDWSDWFMGSRFASNGDTGDVLIDGAGYSTQFLRSV